jgi:hypothetical protein
MDRDRLMRPPIVGSETTEPLSRRSPNLLVPILLAALMAAGILIAYLLGQQSTRPSTPPTALSKIEKEALPTKVSPPVAALANDSKPVLESKPVTVPEKPIELPMAPLKSSDIDKLEAGCACGFSVGKGEFLAVAGETAIFRVNGDAKICPISSEQFDDFYADEGRFQCGSYKVSVSGRGDVGPGFDGHSRKATLRVEKGSLLKVMSGKWLCGC